MNDPIESRTRPLNLGHPPYVTFVRVRLAQANLPQPFVTSEHRNNIGQITEQLANSGCYVAVLERKTEHAFLAMIPGPGELNADRWLMDELPEMPNYITLPFDAPLEGGYLFFHEETGLSSCRDYVLLSTACVECQSIEDCVDNLCWECTKKLELEEVTQFDNVPQVVQLLTPDVLDNSYDAPRH